MNKVIGRLAASATRRRDERDVRVHADAGRTGSPAKHRTRPRDAAGALRQIEAEAPVQRFEGYAYAPRTLTSLRERIDRNRWEAQLKDRNALALMDEAEAQRREADDLEHLLWLGEVTQELRTEVPQAPTPAEGPERAEPSTAHEGTCCCPHCESEAYKDAARAKAEPQRSADVELPESMTPDAVPVPVSGPAVVPQLAVDGAKSAYSRYVIGDGDPDTVGLSPVRDGETRTDIPAVNGVGR